MILEDTTGTNPFFQRAEAPVSADIQYQRGMVVLCLICQPSCYCCSSSKGTAAAGIPGEPDHPQHDQKPPPQLCMLCSWATLAFISKSSRNRRRTTCHRGGVDQASHSPQFDCALNCCLPSLSPETCISLSYWRCCPFAVLVAVSIRVCEKPRCSECLSLDSEALRAWTPRCLPRKRCSSQGR